MGWTTDLLVGIAEHLADSGAGTWLPSGAYSADALAPIFMASVPSKPDVVLTLFDYDVESTHDGYVVQGVQVRLRGTTDSTVVSDLDDAVFDALHGLRNRDLHGVHVVSVKRDSGSWLGTDGSRRHERTSNYYVTATRPSPLFVD